VSFKGKLLSHSLKPEILETENKIGINQSRHYWDVGREMIVCKFAMASVGHDANNVVQIYRLRRVVVIDRWEVHHASLPVGRYVYVCIRNSNFQIADR